MKLKTETTSVNLGTGECRYETVGDGERISRLERRMDDLELFRTRLGPREETHEELLERAKKTAAICAVAMNKLKETNTMRCKVVCSLKQPASFGNPPDDGFYLGFYPVYTGSEENREFFKYTPGGTVTFNVLNRAAAEKFEVGKEYYLDFTPVGS